MEIERKVAQKSNYKVTKFPFIFKTIEILKVVLYHYCSRNFPNCTITSLTTVFLLIEL